MLRRQTRRRLSGEGCDPLSSLGNMADVMFVFSVGLLVALMSVWNVTPFKNTRVIDVEQGQEVKDLPQVESSSGSGYHEMGTVYSDPETGKLIMVQPVGE